MEMESLRTLRWYESSRVLEILHHHLRRHHHSTKLLVQLKGMNVEACKLSCETRVEN